MRLKLNCFILRVEIVRLKLNCSSLEWRLARLNQERLFLNRCEQGKRATPQETQVVSFLVDSPSFQSIVRNYPLSHVWPPVPVYLLFASFSMHHHTICHIVQFLIVMKTVELQIDLQSCSLLLLTHYYILVL